MKSYILLVVGQTSRKKGKPTMKNERHFAYKNRSYQNENIGGFSIIEEDNGSYSLSGTDKFMNEWTKGGFNSFDMAMGYAMCQTKDAKITER